MRIVISLILSILISGNVIYGQEFRSVLGFPNKFSKPIDLQGEEMESYVKSASGPKSGSKPWRVICDREGLDTYSEPSPSSIKKKKLTFKDWYYVADEKGNYLQLVKMNGSPDNNLNIPKGSFVEDFGWVEKSKLLLWPCGLRSARTDIYLKSLILYTEEAADKVIRFNNKGVQFRSGPSASHPSAGDISLYDFYFILKKENGFYLLGRESEMENFSFYKSEIVGWVEQNVQADWNTRLALEQNFTQAAFDERKQRPSLQFVAYPDEISATNQAISGSGNMNRILTKDDPVIAPRNTLAKSDNKRFIGTKLRMPVLRCEEHFYTTGILGSMGKDNRNNECAPCKAAYDEISQFSNNYDILILIEGTTSMRTYKEAIKNAIGNLKRELTDVPNKRFAIAFYRNVNVKGKSSIEVTELTPDIEDLIKKIDEAVFTQDTYDGYSTLFSALSKSAAKVGFKNNSTNIIYVIGQNPDFREDPNLRLNCIDNNCDAWIRTDKLVDQLSNLRAHLIFIQPNLPKNAVNNDLAEQCVDLMLEVSKSNFQSYIKTNELLKIKDENPSIDESSTEYAIHGGSTKNIFYTSGSSSQMAPYEFVNYMRASFKDIKTNLNRVAKALEKSMEDGDQLDESDVEGSGFSVGALQDRLSMILQKAGMEASEENLKKLTDRKVNLYVQAYVPKRIYGASNDLCSPVLFFPEKELGEYLNDLRSLVTLVNEPDDVLRTKLKEALLSLYKKYSGDNKIGNDVTLNDFRAKLVGECFKFENENHNFVLNKIDNPRVKTETLRSFLNELEKKYRKLENLTKNAGYEFKFKTKGGNLGRNQYYWIPFEDTF